MLMISGVSINDLYEDMPFLGVLLKKNEDMAVLNQTLKSRGRI